MSLTPLFFINSSFPYKVSAKGDRQKIGYYLARNKVRKRDYQLLDDAFNGDRYAFKNPKHAVLLRIALDDNQQMI